MKEKIEIAFVILHYKTYNQTINCINSIIKNINQKYIISVVDNFSNNDSIEKIEQEYLLNKNIKIIKSEENLGFAKGNNLGIKWVNDNYDSKFVVVMNNDTQILYENFYDLINQEYKKSGFSVLGPKIILKNNTINPIYSADVTLEKVLRRNKRLKRQIIIRELYLEKVYNFLKKIRKNKKVNKEEVLNPNNYYKNIVLHGCFLIFSKKYFSYYSGFDSRTFLYVEEELLFLRLKKFNLISIYNPDIVVFHEEDVSTNYSIPSERKRALFKLKNIYKSNKILLKDLKEMEKLK